MLTVKSIAKGTNYVRGTNAVQNESSKNFATMKFFFTMKITIFKNINITFLRNNSNCLGHFLCWNFVALISGVLELLTGATYAKILKLCSTFSLISNATDFSDSNKQ